MPEPYLNYPIWHSEEEDMQQDISRHMSKLADECAVIGGEIMAAMDANVESWNPKNLEAMEKFHRELVSLYNYLKTLDL